MLMNAQEEEPHWENDPMWELLDEARTAEVDPFFVSKVMREVRLSSERTLPWWKVPKVVRPLLAGSMATLVAILLIALSDDEFPATNADADPLPVQGETGAPQLDALLEEEMLSQAAENPAAFSDEALVAMLSQ